MRAVVLVGGVGARLRPLTLAVPKQMLPIVEVPMIERVLGHLAAHGVTEAVLSLGYRSEAFLELLPATHVSGMTLRYAVEREPLGTAGAVGFAARAAAIDERFIVMNGDVLTDLDVTALVQLHVDRRARGSIALTPVEDASAFGLVATDDHGRVLAFVEKPVVAQVSPGLVNAGAYVLEPSVLTAIPEGRQVSIEREVFPGMADDGTLFALASTAYWTDTGTPERYLQAHLDLLEGRRGGPPAPGAVADAGGVWTLSPAGPACPGGPAGPGGPAVIDGQVLGPSFVGPAAFVQRGASVERSVVGAGARVHEGARIRDSVLMAGAVVGAGAVVERSLVGQEAVIGEGSKLCGLTVVGPSVEVAAGADLQGARVPDA